MKIVSNSLYGITAILTIFNFAKYNKIMATLLLICGVLLLVDVIVDIIKCVRVKK